MEKLDKVRIGMVGVGGMGTSHVSNFLKIEGCEIVAVCDIMESRVERAQKMAVDAGFKNLPDIQTENMTLSECVIVTILILFSQPLHEMACSGCLEAMNSGKHAATEVPAALTISECWQLIEASENTGKHCIMMENCNYDREEMIILKDMVKNGLFGDLLHARCGYLHD
ncbi:MAG: Gfo/Idh/MocA family oxidoreductase [Bacteroidales bacterium]